MQSPTTIPSTAGPPAFSSTVRVLLLKADPLVDRRVDRGQSRIRTSSGRNEGPQSGATAVSRSSATSIRLGASCRFRDLRLQFRRKQRQLILAEPLAGTSGSCCQQLPQQVFSSLAARLFRFQLFNQIEHHLLQNIRAFGQLLASMATATIMLENLNRLALGDLIHTSSGNHIYKIIYIGFAGAAAISRI